MTDSFSTSCSDDNKNTFNNGGNNGHRLKKRYWEIDCRNAKELLM